MFVCESCKRLTQPGERQEVVPVAIRTVFYLARTDRECIGHETVREMKVCPECAPKLEDADEEVVGHPKYVEFPKKEEDCKQEMPTNTVMARWPRNYGRMKKQLARQRMRERRFDD